MAVVPSWKKGEYLIWEPAGKLLLLWEGTNLIFCSAGYDEQLCHSDRFCQVLVGTLLGKLWNAGETTLTKTSLYLSANNACISLGAVSLWAVREAEAESVQTHTCRRCGPYYVWGQRSSSSSWTEKTLRDSRCVWKECGGKQEKQKPGYLYQMLAVVPEEKLYLLCCHDVCAQG